MARRCCRSGNNERLTSASAIVGDMVKAGKVKVVAARYDLETGSVEFLSPKA